MKKSSLPVYNIRELEAEALEEYIECPKFPTIVLKADHKDNTEFHCSPMIPFVGPALQGTDPFNRYFLIPKQEVTMVEDSMYGQFSVTKVLHEKNGPMFWLLSSTRSRMGFLLPFDRLREEDLEPKSPVAFRFLRDILQSREWASEQTLSCT